MIPLWDRRQPSVLILDNDYNTRPCVTTDICFPYCNIATKSYHYSSTSIVCVLQAKPENSSSHARFCVCIPFSELCPGNADRND